MLTLSQPLISFPNLLQLIDSFEKISGFKINPEKTEALPLFLTEAELSSLKSHFPFKWKKDSIRYLGVNITKSYATLYGSNFPPLLKQIERDLDRWSSYGISWIGKIYSVKMNVLPRLLYLFETLPVRVPSKVLDRFQKDIRRFIWGRKRPRVPFSVMESDRSRGGLSVPNFKLYYLASHLRQAIEWSAKPLRYKWMQIEQASVHPGSLGSMLWYNGISYGSYPSALPTVRFTKTIWDSTRLKFGLRGVVTSLERIREVPGCPAEALDFISRHSEDPDIFYLKDLYDPSTGSFLPISVFQLQFQLPPSSFLPYLQLRSCTASKISSNNLPPLTEFEKMTLETQRPSQTISKLYGILSQKGSQQPASHNYMTYWEEEFNESLDYIRPHTRKMVNHILTAAQLKISANWKNNHPPTLEEVVLRIRRIRIMEYLSSLVNDYAGQFGKTWDFWDINFDLASES
ncbi:uncharacterized protein [Hyperolius riggenbachi]|uniref:uncharacterized protein n=1 Tax=Hyperolius riggenbachi TaxID=752182 RepID=UPI0035A386E5